MRCWKLLLVLALLAVGCTNVPANVAVDEDRIDQNVQGLLKAHEADLAAKQADLATKKAAAAPGADTSAIDSALTGVRHDLLLSQTTRAASATLQSWMLKNTNQADFDKEKAARQAQAAVPAGGGK